MAPEKMDNTPEWVIEDAIAAAALLHQGQLDKAGRPYIYHPLRVMEAMELDDLDGRMAAVLHDVVEDCDTTTANLVLNGCPYQVAIAVDLLTKTPGQKNKEYISKLKVNPIAKRVKRADILDNKNKKRLDLLPLAEQHRLNEKYEKHLRWLEEE